MAEFCKCGSLILTGKCSNKSCAFRVIDRTLTPAKSSKRKAQSSQSSSLTAKIAAKPQRTRRSSKCITYNLYDVKQEESGAQ